MEKTTTDDALLTNASGQNPLDLLIMFINYGNISLTSNLLKVRVLAFVMFHPLTLLKGCENVSNGFDDGHFQYCEWLTLVLFSQPFHSVNGLFIRDFSFKYTLASVPEVIFLLAPEFSG